MHVLVVLALAFGPAHHARVPQLPRLTCRMYGEFGGSGYKAHCWGNERPTLRSGLLR
jgi:hypothetical protein